MQIAKSACIFRIFPRAQHSGSREIDATSCGQAVGMDEGE